MKQDTISQVLQAGKECGADLTELFVEETRRALVSYKDRKVESASAGTDFGVGIRLLYGTDVLYAYTSHEDPDALVTMVRNLAATRGCKPEHDATIPAFDTLEFINKHRVKIDPANQSQRRKVTLLTEADRIAREYPDVTQVAARAFDWKSNVIIANSEGLYAEDERVRSRFIVGVTAGSGDELFSGSESPGALKGGEFYDELPLESVVKTAADRAVLMLKAGYVEGGKMPVIIGNAFGGVIFHEACGHPLETAAVRRKASPFCDKMGEKIGQSCLTAIDDGTLENVWGSLNIDDEGMPVEKTVLIENGVLKNFMADRVGAEELGLPRTGSGRRQGYQYAPVSRMRNTYIAAGEHTVEQMIASVDEGLYAKSMGGGSVNPATGEFNFAVQEAYKIKKGKLAEPVRGATLIGKGHEVLPEISMIGDDLAFAAGMCGASSGSVPVTVGQPTLKVESILVGGR